MDIDFEANFTPETSVSPRKASLTSGTSSPVSPIPSLPPVKINVVEKARIGSADKVLTGTFVAPSVGIFRIKWDNSYSMLRSKEIWYNIDIYNNEMEKSIKTTKSPKSEGEDSPSEKLVPFSFSSREYFGAHAKEIDISSFCSESYKGNKILKPKDNVTMVPQPKTKEKTKIFSATIYMSTEFPITIEHIIPIAEILSRTNRHFENVLRFFESKLPPGTKITQ